MHDFGSPSRLVCDLRLLELAHLSSTPEAKPPGPHPEAASIQYRTYHMMCREYNIIYENLRLKK